MTEEEKKQMLAAFEMPQQEPEVDETYWTDERLIEAVKRIIRRLDLDGELQ